MHWDTVGDAMDELTWVEWKWIAMHASENCGTARTLCEWNTWQDTTCLRCDQEEEDEKHAFQCNHHTNKEGKVKIENTLKETMDESDTCGETKQVKVEAIKSWLRRTQGGNGNGWNNEVNMVHQEQQSIGWHNLLVGPPVARWESLQHQDCKRRGKRRSGKKWVTMTIKKVDGHWVGCVD